MQSHAQLAIRVGIFGAQREVSTADYPLQRLRRVRKRTIRRCSTTDSPRAVRVSLETWCRVFRMFTVVSPNFPPVDVIAYLLRAQRWPYASGSTNVEDMANLKGSSS